jgi:hypothetical protein
VSYGRQSAAVRVDLAAGTARSAPSGADTLRGIENVSGGTGDDTLLGDRLANRLTGAGGEDRLEGRGGADVLLGDGAAEDEQDEDDEDVGLTGPPDRRDYLDGGTGNDDLRPGQGTRDVLRCGPGKDRVVHMGIEDRFSGCETNGLDDASLGVDVPLGPAVVSASAITLPLSCSGARTCLMIAKVLDARQRLLGEFRDAHFRPGAPARRVRVKLTARGRRALRGRPPRSFIVALNMDLPYGSTEGSWRMAVRR